MSGDNGVIDLLDSDEEVDSGISAKDAASSKSNYVPAADEEIVILSDAEDETDTKDQPPQQRQSSYVVRNPYARSTTVTQKRCAGSAPTINESKQSHDMEIYNPYKKKRKESEYDLIDQSKDVLKNTKQYKPLLAPKIDRTELQAGLVFEEDVGHIKPNLAPKKVGLKQAPLFSKKALEIATENKEPGPDSAAAYVEHQTTTRISKNLQPILFHDSEFTAGNPATIDGIHMINKSNKSAEKSSGDFVLPPAPKCRCKPAKPCILAYTAKGQNIGRPYYKCSNNNCKYFSWAFTSYMLHWYRFGAHNGHCLVNPCRGFKAEDLVQGKVGDCWFLSALAVVAEREDLIQRLIGASSYNDNDPFGVVEVTLFVDGYWKKIVMDSFLPCFVDAKKEKKEQDDMKRALEQSLVAAGLHHSSVTAMGSSSTVSRYNTQSLASSRFDPNAIADQCRTTLNEIQEFIHNDRFNKDPAYRSSTAAKKSPSLELNRRVTTLDLAYSKAKLNQLWVPFLEKAYAKMHGSYKAISGGHVAEAFLDLTGAPTAVYNFDHHDFQAKKFWGELMTYRRKKLPMGCGTSQSQEGIVGMHAYSILDVREVKNVGAEFFYDKIAQGTLGNVSGFTELDGTVRLLRIRNPHGQGEWKGEFSDKSDVWQKLLAHKNGAGRCVDLTKPMSPELQRTMANDGTFWIGYDDFLMGFSNVDVVLAFQGNHAKSFASNFPPKLSNHRCNRAFELSVVGLQPGESDGAEDDVEVFIMCIQKTRRGASHGRADRKKSYKACDIGILVGEANNNASDGSAVELESVDGRCFGLNRNGHVRLLLNRRNTEKRLIVCPISFGHPSATDESLSFVVRFVSDAPLLVRELTRPPKMNLAVQKFCFGNKVMSLGVAGTSHHRGLHGQKTVIFERKLGGSYLFRLVRVDCLAGGGGTVLFYLVVNDARISLMSPSRQLEAMSFSLEANCRGMSCRTTNGLEKHEVISKGKKFEAAWRRFTLEFREESQSRLLCVLIQSGQDFQVGSVKCTPLSSEKVISIDTSQQKKLRPKHKFDSYEEHGIFASSDTPSDIESVCNHQYELKAPSNIDNELTLALRRSREEYRTRHNKKDDNEVISLCDSFETSNCTLAENINIESAIMASIKENHASKCSNTSDTEDDEELKKAIELSLMTR